MKTELNNASSAATGRNAPMLSATAVPTITGATDAASVRGRTAMIQTAGLKPEA